MRFLISLVLILGLAGFADACHKHKGRHGRHGSSDMSLAKAPAKPSCGQAKHAPKQRKNEGKVSYQIRIKAKVQGGCNCAGGKCAK